MLAFTLNYAQSAARPIAVWSNVVAPCTIEAIPPAAVKTGAAAGARPMRPFDEAAAERG